MTVPFPSIAVRWIYHRKVAAKHTMEPRWTYGHAQVTITWDERRNCDECHREADLCASVAAH